MTEISHGPTLRFKLISGLVVALLLFFLVEYTVSVLYEPERDVYPNFDTETAAFNYGIFEDDADCIRKLKPNVAVSHPKSRQVMCTSSRGYRGLEFQDGKEEGVFRVVFLGDACLFGMGLGEVDTIPEVLGRELKRLEPGLNTEIINLAVPGYTSFQGLVQAERLVPALKADLVVIGFGFSDAALVNYTDAQVQASIPGSKGLFATLERFLSWSSLFELMRNKFRSKEERRLLGQTRFNGIDGPGITARVPPDEFRFNVTSIIDAVRAAGGRCLLLDPNLANYYSADALAAMANEKGVPCLSARGILEKKKPPGRYSVGDPKRYRRQMAIQFRGFPEGLDDGLHTPFLVKVPLGRIRFPVAPAPERPPFVDDGSRGDRKAGDGIYTALLIDDGPRDFEITPSMKILMSQDMTRQLFLNEERFYRLPDVAELEDGGLYYSPVMEFRKPTYHEYVMDFDSNLPNKDGARAIAEALASSVVKVLED